MDRRKNSLTKWTVGSQLPMLALPGRSLIEIVGCSRVLIENHRGVIAYTRELVRVRTSDGIVSVCGLDMIIRCMSRFQLVVTGSIHTVKLETGR